MSERSPTYDLVMLLDAALAEDDRAKLVAGARSQIEGKGEIVRHDEWGDRQLAYPIAKRKDAFYHLLQFKASTPELLADLDRTLRITDGVLRFRLVKLKPGTPDAPDMRAAAPDRHVEHAPSEPVAAVAGDGAAEQD